MTTVIVKATFTLAQDGRATLAEVQEPLELDQRTNLSDSELYRCSDFVPRKAATDVLIVGHARADRPARVLPISFTVGALTATRYAVSDEATDRVPLLSRWIRAQAGDPSSTRVLAPRKQRVDDQDDPRASTPVDFSQFNYAAPENRLASFKAGATVSLRGLLVGAAERTVEMATVEPWVFYVPDRRGAILPSGQRVAMACDTVWIDTDRALCCLTWRGLVSRSPSSDAQPVAVVALGLANAEVSWSELAEQLPRAEWSRAVTEEDLPPRPMWRYEAPATTLTAETAQGSSETTAIYSARRQATITALLDMDEPESQATEQLDVDIGKLTARTEQMDGDPSELLRSTDDDAEKTTTTIDHEQPDDDGDDDAAGEEPAPLTPRAGMQLGQGMGFALGGSTLGSQPGKKPLPFGGQAPTTEPRETTTEAKVAAIMERLGDHTNGGATIAMEAVSPGPGLPFEKKPTAGDTLPPGAPEPAEPPAAAHPASRQTPDPGTAFVACAQRVRRKFAATAAMEAVPPMQAPIPFQQVPSVHPQPRQSAVPADDDALPFRPSVAPTHPGASPPTEAQSLPPPQEPPVQPVTPTPTPGIAPFPAPVALGGSSVSPPPPAPSSPAAVESSPQQRDKPSGLAGTDVPLATYAAVKAALWDGTQSLDSVLERHAIDETTWRTVERRKSAAIAREASTGRTDLADQIRLAIAKARREQTDDGTLTPDLTVTEFAALQVALDETSDPAPLLRKRNIEPEAWSQLQRQWAHRAKADSKLAASLRRELAAARKTAQEDSGEIL